MPPLKSNIYPTTSSGTYSSLTLCLPSMIHLVIGLISLIIVSFRNFSLAVLLIKAFFLFLWSWLLDFFCRNGYASLSWFLVLLPYVLILFYAVFFPEQLEIFKNTPRNSTHLDARNLLY